MMLMRCLEILFYVKVEGWDDASSAVQYPHRLVQKKKKKVERLTCMTQKGGWIEKMAFAGEQGTKGDVGQDTRLEMVGSTRADSSDVDHHFAFCEFQKRAREMTRFVVVEEKKKPAFLVSFAATFLTGEVWEGERKKGSCLVGFGAKNSKPWIEESKKKMRRETVSPSRREGTANSFS